MVFRAGGTVVDATPALQDGFCSDGHMCLYVCVSVKKILKKILRQISTAFL